MKYSEIPKDVLQSLIEFRINWDNVESAVRKKNSVGEEIILVLFKDDPLRRKARTINLEKKEIRPLSIF